MLSKKYYKALAEMIGKSNNLEDFVKKLEGFLFDDNYRFDLGRFESAIAKTRNNK